MHDNLLAVPGYFVLSFHQINKFSLKIYSSSMADAEGVATVLKVGGSVWDTRHRWPFSFFLLAFFIIFISYNFCSSNIHPCLRAQSQKTKTQIPAPQSLFYVLGRFLHLWLFGFLPFNMGWDIIFHKQCQED